jgi:hypothetical protein
MMKGIKEILNIPWVILVIIRLERYWKAMLPYLKQQMDVIYLGVSQII